MTLENKNFLNNQNYILGNSEKKKLLSKFFWERNVHNMFTFFWKMDSFFYNLFNKSYNWYLSLFIFIGFITTIWILFYLWSLKILFSFIFLSIIFFLYKINNHNSTFLITSIIIISIIWFFSWLTLFVSIINVIDIGIFSITFKNFIYFGIIPSCLLTLVYFFYKTKLAYIKILNIIIFHFILLYQLFYLIFSFIFVFLIRWFKWFLFYKKFPEKDILKKFVSIKNDSAENSLYKVKIKL